MAVTLDYTGVSILANKGDGTTEDVTALCTFDPPDGTEVTTPGRILVKATYTENAGADDEQTFDTYFEIGVGSIVRLDVTQTPDKMTYYVGEFIDLTGMIVTAFLSDGSTVDVTADCTTIPPDGTEVLTVGNIIVDVFYKDGQGAGQFEMTAEAAPRQIIDGGDWWTLWDDGELEIFCEGDMPDYASSSGQPWASHRSDILFVTIEDSVTSIGNMAFSDCTNLTTVTIPDSVNYIGDSAFNYCTSLTSVAIPDGVTSIFGYTFKECTSLTDITIPDSVTFIGMNAFQYCESLTSITIPDGVTEIGQAAFSGCTSLTSITIPDSLNYITGSTFSGCTSLTVVNMPNSVTSVGANAFFGCSNLSDVYYDGTEEQWEQIFIGSGNTPLTSATIHFAGISFYKWAEQEGAPEVLTDPDDYSEAVRGMPFTITMGGSLIWKPTIADLFKENTCAFVAGNDKTQGFLIYFHIDLHIYPKAADNYSGVYNGNGSCEVSNIDGRSFLYTGNFLKFTNYYEGTWIGMFIQLKAPVSGVYRLDTTAPLFDGYVSVLNNPPIHDTRLWNASYNDQTCGAGESVKADRYIKRYESSHTTCMSMVSGTLYLPTFEVLPTVTNPNLAARPGLLADSPVNENAQTFTNPVTGELINFLSYEYNYESRAYSLTLPNDGKINVTFGDNAIIIEDLSGGETTEAMYHSPEQD